MMTYKNTFAYGMYGGRENLDFGIQPTDRVLDLGGGENSYLKSTDVIDKSDIAVDIQRCGRKMSIGNRTLLDGYAEEILPTIPNKYFDFIYSSHTLEHLDNLPLVLKEIGRTCKRGFLITPHYYMDLWCNDLPTHHQWLFAYDHKRNILQYRRRLSHEYLKELSEVDPSALDWRNTLIQSHYNTLNIRGLWEIRFYWEDQVDYEEKLDIAEESLYIKEKFFSKPVPHS